MQKCFIRVLPLAIAALAAACSGDPAERAREHVASGDGYIANGKRAEAIIEYRKALQEQPRSGDARFKLAEAYSKSEEPLRALREYVRAADLMPDNREAQIKAAGALLLGRRFDEAKVRMERLVAQNPADAEARILLANALAQVKDLDSAIKQAEEAISLDPAEPRRRAALGAVYLQQGDAIKAEEALKKAVELRPDDVQVLLALANFYWSTGKGAEAETMFKRAYAAAPGQLVTNRALAALYMSSQRMPEAEPYLKRVVSLSPGVAPQLALADYYSAINRTDDAKKILNALLTQPEAVAESKARIAALEYESGNRTQAYALLEEALKSDEKNQRTRLLRVRLLLRDGRNEETTAESARALDIDPSSAAAQYVHGAVLEAAGDRLGARRAYNEVLRLNPRATQAQLRLSEISLQEGTVDLAVQFAAQALASDPTSGDARMKLVRALLARRDLSGAQKEITPLLAQYPTSPAIQTLAGLIRTEQGNYGGARAAFEKALEKKPHSADALAGLLAVDAATNRLTQSQARIDQGLTASPDDPQLLVVGARAAVLERNWPKAQELLRRALAVDAGNLTAYAMLGTTYAKQGQLDEARREFEQLADRDQSSVAAATMVAVILHSQNRLDDSQVWYERALKTDPGAPVAANNLAWLLADSNRDLDRALRLADIARSRLPQDAEINDTMGWIRYRRGEFAQAIPALSRSVEQDPSNPVYLYHLGLAYMQTGQKKEARDAFETALALKKDFRDSPDARRLLAEL